MATPTADQVVSLHETETEGRGHGPHDPGHVRHERTVRSERRFYQTTNGLALIVLGVIVLVIASIFAVNAILSALKNDDPPAAVVPPPTEVYDLGPAIEGLTRAIGVIQTDVDANAATDRRQDGDITTLRTDVTELQGRPLAAPPAPIPDPTPAPAPAPAADPITVPTRIGDVIVIPEGWTILPNGILVHLNPN